MARSQSQPMLNRFDLINPPQFLAEGYGPDNYGNNKAFTSFISTSPDVPHRFIAPFQVGKMTIANNPSFVDNLFAGELDRQGVIKVWEANTVTVSGRVLNNTTGFDLLKWAIKKPQNYTTDPGSSNLTPDQSRTWIYSFKDSGARSGTHKDKPRLNYVLARGCKVQTANVNIPNKDLLSLELTMNVQSVYVITVPYKNVATWDYMAADQTAEGVDPNNSAFDSTKAHGLLGTAEYKIDGSKIQFTAKESLEQPMKFQDVGAFYYKPVGDVIDGSSGNAGISAQNLAFQSLNLGVDYTHRMQDSNGYDRTLYLDFAARTGTGTLALYKLGSEFNEDARTDNLQTAWLELNNFTGDKHGKLQLSNTAPKITLFAKVPGTLGNKIKFAYVVGTGATNTLDVNGKDITFTAKTGGATGVEIKNLIETNRDADKLIAVSTVGAQTGKISASVASGSLQAFTTGVDKTDKLIFENFKFQPSWEDLIDQSEATIESKSIQADQITFSNKT